MKKALLACFAVISLPFPGSAEPIDQDPFAEKPPVSIDRSKDKKSDEYLSDERLKAFEEKKLDAGVEKETARIRITVLRSFDAPLIFTLYPAAPGQESLLEVKRLKVIRNADGEQSYQGLDFNQKLKLRPAQNQLLKTIYQDSPLQDLPQADWQGDSLDGSIWIYEAAAEDGSIRIVRRNPIKPSTDGTKVSLERLTLEMHLSTFSLMLWTLSGIDERPY